MGGLENDLDRLIRSSGEGVPVSHRQAAQLFNPPLRDVGAFMMQQQQQGLASFADEFLNPLAVPSPTAPWHNLVSMDNDPFASSSGSAPFATSNGLFLQQLQKDLLSDPIADFQTSVWGFGDNQNTPKIGNNFDAIHELLNTPISSVASLRNQLSGQHQALGNKQLGDNDFYMRACSSQKQFPSSSPQITAASFSSVSPSSSITHGRRSPSPAPLPPSGASTRPSTPNSSISSGSFSDGPEDDASKLPGLLGPSASTSKRKTPDRAMNENEDIQSPELKRPSNKSRKKGPKRVREPRYAIKTRSDVEIMEDGYKWRKYGQKAVKNSPHPRSYYRCTIPKCPVRKRVERSAEDTGLVITTYEGTHTHVSPAINSRTSGVSDAPSLPASGENRPGGAAYQPPTSSFPFASANSVPPTSHSNYDLTVQLRSDHASAATSSLSSQAQDIQMHGGSGCNGILQPLNIQEPATSLLRGHGSLQEFSPCSQDLSFLRAQQLLGALSSDCQLLRASDNFRVDNFGPRCLQGEDGDLLRALQIPFWNSSSNNSEPLSTTTTTTTKGMVVGIGDECVRDQSSPINEGLLGDVVRLGVRW